MAETRPRSGQRLRWFLWLACLAGWTVALLIPPPIKPATGLRDPEVLFTTAKLTHVLVYAALAGGAAVLAAGIRQHGLMVAVLVAHAAITEFLQWLFPELNRFGTVRDVLLDCLGIGLGMSLVVVWKWRRRGVRHHTPVDQETAPPGTSRTASAAG